MSIDATTNYMSNSAIEAWMEGKTEDLYGNLRGAMGTSNDRADAETALNQIKSDLTAAGKSGDNPTAIRDEIQQTIHKYGDEFPEVATALKGMLDTLNTRLAPPPPATPAPPLFAVGRSGDVVPVASPTTASTPAPPAKVSTDDAKDWGDTIGNLVDDLGKADQLGLINIQEFNSQINQTKQIASALMDATDKSAEAIISHIS